MNIKITDKIIIAGFPGVGKSHAATILPNNVIVDHESSSFHWIYDNNYNKTESRLWPDNYITLIKMLAYETDGLTKYNDLKYICISTHEQVLKKLIKQKIPFVIAIPKDKEETIKRYRNRGNSEEFINKLNESWDSWMEEFKNYNMPIIELDSDKYLSDILIDSDNMTYNKSTYDYLKNRVDLAYKYILDIDDEEDDPMSEIINGLCDHFSN